MWIAADSTWSEPGDIDPCGIAGRRRWTAAYSLFLMKTWPINQGALIHEPAQVGSGAPDLPDALSRALVRCSDILCARSASRSRVAVW